MPGPAPKKERRRRNVPARGEWKSAPGVGWQHGPIPAPPDGLSPVALEAWNTWMTAWWASYWTPADLPGLRLVVRAFDNAQGMRSASFHHEVIRLMDAYGITPAGQQARRWTPPKAEPTTPAADLVEIGAYAHLRAGKEPS